MQGIEQKKEVFRSIVKKISSYYNLGEIPVNFQRKDCPSPPAENIIHAHTAEYLICCFEASLGTMDEEEIKKVAVREALHIVAPKKKPEDMMKVLSEDKPEEPKKMQKTDIPIYMHGLTRRFEAIISQENPLPRIDMKQVSALVEFFKAPDVSIRQKVNEFDEILKQYHYSFLGDCSDSMRKEMWQVLGGQPTLTNHDWPVNDICPICKNRVNIDGVFEAKRISLRKASPFKVSLGKKFVQKKKGYYEILEHEEQGTIYKCDKCKYEHYASRPEPQINLSTDKIIRGEDAKRPTSGYIVGGLCAIIIIIIAMVGMNNLPIPTTTSFITTTTDMFVEMTTTTTTTSTTTTSTIIKQLIAFAPDIEGKLFFYIKRDSFNTDQNELMKTAGIYVISYDRICKNSRLLYSNTRLRFVSDNKSIQKIFDVNPDFCNTGMIAIDWDTILG